MNNKRTRSLKNTLNLSLLTILLSSGFSYAESSLPLSPQAKSLPSQTFLVGSWTGQTTGDRVQKAIYPSQGVYRVRLNSDGSFTPLDVFKIGSPSWIVFSHDYKYVYTTNENENGSVTAFKIGLKGELIKLNEVDSLGAQPTHAVITRDNKLLVVANYSVEPGHAGITIFKIQSNGSLSKSIQNIPFIDGSHEVKGRQDSGHAHSVNITPDGKILYAADLGADTIHAFSYNPGNPQPFQAEPSFDLHFKPGEGPRHMTFSSNGKFAYVSTEMSAQVHVYRLEKNTLREIQSVDLTENKDLGFKGGSGIIFSPDNKFLYVGNRQKSNEIVTYRVNSETGKLTFSGRFLSGGIEPRAFAFDKTGQYMLIANVFSNNVVELKRNVVDGSLAPTSVTLQIGTPTDIKFFK